MQPTHTPMFPASRLARLFLLLAMLAAGPLHAEAADPVQLPGEDLRVFLLTMGHGDELWERFGHNALWIHDAQEGTDVVYNWGLFSFDEEGFLLRFLRGEMLYWMDGVPLPVTLAEYEQRNRSVWAQELALTPAQRAELREFAEWNRLPQNRYYRYDYFRDNCSTRVRDALNLVLDGALRQEAFDAGRGTYRWHARRLVQDMFVIDRGMHILLGPRSDVLLTRWEEAFLPKDLMELVSNTMVEGEGGAEVPLVVETRTLFEADRPPQPAEAPGFRLGFLAFGLLAGVGLAALSAPRFRGGSAGRWALGLAGAGWCLLAAFFGTIFVLGWLWTDHVFMHGNENILQMNPLSLLRLPAFLGAAVSNRWVVPARALALVVLTLSVSGLLLKAFPGFIQSNLDVIALTLPAHAGLAVALLRIRPDERDR